VIQAHVRLLVPHVAQRYHVIIYQLTIKRQSGLIPCLVPTIMSAINSDPETKATKQAVASDADNEPQNSLTQKFTEKEWAALKEFRVISNFAFSSRFDTLTATFFL